MSKPAAPIPTLLKQIAHPKTIWGGLLITVTVFNLLTVTRELILTPARRKINPYMFYGFAFSGIDRFLTGVKAIGYYTDRDLDQNNNAAVFAQAQYTLAPVIVDLNNLEHEYILFDCTSEETAMAKIKEVGAIPLKKNNAGIILAKRKP